MLLPDLAPCGDAVSARLLAARLPKDRFRVTVGVTGVRRFRRMVLDEGPVVFHAWGPFAARVARLVVENTEWGNVPRLIVSGAASPGGGVGGWLTARQLRRADRVVPATWADGE